MAAPAAPTMPISPSSATRAPSNPGVTTKMRRAPPVLWLRSVVGIAAMRGGHAARFVLASLWGPRHHRSSGVRPPRPELAPDRQASRRRRLAEAGSGWSTARPGCRPPRCRHRFSRLAVIAAFLGPPVGSPRALMRPPPLQDRHCRRQFIGGPRRQVRRGLDENGGRHLCIPGGARQVRLVHRVWWRLLPPSPAPPPDAGAAASPGRAGDQRVAGRPPLRPRRRTARAPSNRPSAAARSVHGRDRGPTP